MRSIVPIILELRRIKDVPYGNEGMSGAFEVLGPEQRMLRIISSEADQEYEWEHVSVSLVDRTPTWDEMCFVKHLFWYERECVVQFHPPKSEYVNFHPYCLHLWKPTMSKMPVPPSILVGPKSST